MKVREGTGGDDHVASEPNFLRSMSFSGGSPKSAAGCEDTMQDFVRLHMMSILHPFSEQIRELQVRCEQLSSEVHRAREVADQRAEQLGRHEEQLTGLGTSVADSGEKVEKACSELLTLRREKTKLEGNHEMTKATVGKTKEMLQSTSSLVEKVQASLQSECVKIGKLQASLAETEKRLMEHVEFRMDRQGKLCKDLNERQAELLKSMQQAKSSSDATSLALKKLTGSVEQRRSEDASLFASHAGHSRVLEAKLQETSALLQTQVEGLKGTEKEVQHLKTWATSMSELKNMAQQQAEANMSMKEHLRRLEKAEEDIAQARSETMTERQMRISDFGVLEEKVGCSISDIQRLKETQKLHSSTLQSAGLRTEEIESDLRKHRERIDASEREISTIVAWRQVASKSLELHETGLERNRADQNRSSAWIEGASVDLERLRSDIGDDRAVISKMGSRLDMCYKYFHGLGKGLQDTHRQVHANAASEGGGANLLPPKSGGTSSALPTIPKTPRTPRTTGKTPSPRRKSASHSHLT
eukprot:TRINITY_DN33981_c0_g1_i1.p1 TRINITY_DN33981_c0_g1~~TRINITY_DN33981_c0_g1_i1.p1  ORF type:complete len:529 (-),score=129.05 TRINITY_DN33981_c0_g1_i1:38-1624(-)